jgi:hypothetical protein
MGLDFAFNRGVSYQITEWLQALFNIFFGSVKITFSTYCTDIAG